MVKHLAGREGVRICPAVPLSCTRTYAALVAQRIEQEPSKLLVAGSSPAGGTKVALCKPTRTTLLSGLFVSTAFMVVFFSGLA